MPEQTTLDLAFADRHAGQDRNIAASTNVLRDTRARVETALAQLVRRGKRFSADDVHKLLADGDPYDANVVSSVMGRWAKDGRIIEHYGRPVPSQRRSRHASRNRQWRGAA